MLLGSMGATNVTPNSPPSDAAVHSLGSHTLANENFLGFAIILSTPFLTPSFGLLVSKGVQDGLSGIGGQRGHGDQNGSFGCYGQGGWR